LRPVGRKIFLTGTSTMGGVAHAVDDDLVVPDRVEDKVGIRRDDDAPQAAPTG